ncbi:DUF4886 domain-containing protein [Paenibacillus montanisoli]|nr:DUF4886 domain-containing protein [Paenibacillus montanisoli]
MKKPKKIIPVSLLVALLCTMLLGSIPSLALASTVLTTNFQSIPQGGSISISYTGTSNSDWIGIYPKGVLPGDRESLIWAYTSDYAQPDGAMDFSKMTGGTVGKVENLAVGDYTAYLCLNDGYDILAQVDFSVTGDAPSTGAATISLSANTIVAGNSLEVSYTGTSANDWIGIFDKGAVPSNGAPYYYWFYTSWYGQPDGKVDLIELTDGWRGIESLPPGEYSAVILKNDGYEVLASADFSVTESPVADKIKPKSTIKVLAIGNSFSDDAMRFLPFIAQNAGVNLEIANLYVGGCSLETHWTNATNDIKAYDYHQLGKPNKQVSIKEALESDDWDFVTFQQVSGLSGILDSYFPYLPNLVDYVKGIEPNAKLALHETWAYAKDSTHQDFPRYDNDQDKMFNALKQAYLDAAKKTGISIIIPSGESWQNARATSIGDTLTRDGYHGNTKGQYLAAATWFSTLTGKDISKSAFSPYPNQPELVSLLNQSVDKAVSEYKNIIIPAAKIPPGIIGKPQIPAIFSSTR